MMNKNQIENLKKLIEKSPILNDREKKEWLVLLELMNDKQIVELEKILLENPPKKSAAETAEKFSAGKTLPPAPPVVPPRPVSPPVLTTKPAQVSSPLKHIVNLPNRVAGPRRPPAPAVGGDGRHEESLTGKAGFLARLKKIIKEEELPPGHPQNELELPDKIEIPQPIRPPAPLPAVKKTDIPAPKPAVRQQPVSAAAYSRPEGSADVQKQEAFKPSFVPGLKIDNASKTRSETLEAIKAHMAAGKNEGSAKFAAEQPPVKKMPPAVFDFNDPDELSSLDMKNWDILTSESFLPKIKKLIAKFGYFDVIFHLEKSPVYKIYLDTGAKLLSQKATFEDLAGISGGIFFSRVQFENFVDLLRKLKAD